MSGARANFCCDMMRDNILNTCEQHPNRFDCPDMLLAYDEKTDSYGVIVHDGGSSVVKTQYCPWCGSALRDLSDLLFDELEKIDPDWEWASVPKKYRTAEWWREKGL